MGSGQQDFDPLVHENLVKIMDRRLSNVQLQARMIEARLSLESNGQSSMSEQRLFMMNNNFIYRQSDGTTRTTRREDSYSSQGPTRHYHQLPQKRRRSTLWETITGLVCSLGALATRAAKMTAARRTDSL